MLSDRRIDLRIGEKPRIGAGALVNSTMIGSQATFQSAPPGKSITWSCPATPPRVDVTHVPEPEVAQESLPGKTGRGGQFLARPAMVLPWSGQLSVPGVGAPLEVHAAEWPSGPRPARAGRRTCWVDGEVDR